MLFSFLLLGLIITCPFTLFLPLSLSSCFCLLLQLLLLLLMFMGQAAAAAKWCQSCLTLCDPIDCSSPGSSVPGILQARTLEWVAIAFSSAWKWKVKSESEVAQSCPTLHDPMDCSPPGSSVHGILQGRVGQDWVTSLSLSNVTSPIRVNT